MSKKMYMVVKVVEATDEKEAYDILGSQLHRALAETKKYAYEDTCAVLFPLSEIQKVKSTVRK